MILQLIKCFSASFRCAEAAELGLGGSTDAGAALITNSKLSNQRMALNEDDSRAVGAQAKNLIKSSNELRGRQLACMANTFLGSLKANSPLPPEEGTRLSGPMLVEQHRKQRIW